MMNKICPRCRTVYKYNADGCPNGCNKKLKSESDKIYDKRQRKNHEFYNSKAWKRLRESCKSKYSNICIWTMYKHNRIIEGRTAHHIIPIEVDMGLALNGNNLLFVSDEAHREIHMLYKLGTKENFKKINSAILKEIQQYIKRWEKEK